MKPPVEHVRVSAKGKEILIKIKRRTGLEHWNEICRIALCNSLANETIPPKFDKHLESSIDMDWKVFAGLYHDELSYLILYRAAKDNIDTSKKEIFNEFVKCHIERGISMMQNVKNISDLIKTC